jgi:hypothetical protein
MEDLEQRTAALRQDGLLVGIAGFSLLSGMHFSPYFEPAFILVKFFGPAFFVNSTLLLLYFTSLLVSLSALVIAGVPAALFERLTGRRQSDAVSLGIWCAGCALIAMPSLLRSSGG